MTAKGYGGCEPCEATINASKVGAHVDQVHVEGLKKTKDDLVAAIVRDLFKAQSLDEVIVQAQHTKNKMEMLGIFNNVGTFMDTSKDPCAGKDAYEIFYNVKERKSIIGGVNTYMGTNTANVNFSVLLPNVFGRAEKVKIEYEYGTKHTSTFGVSYAKPSKSDPRKWWSFGVLQNYADNPWSCYWEADRGVKTEFSFNSKKFKQSLSWSGLWREICCADRTAPMSVRMHSGHSLKSAIVHSIILDNRNSTVLPTSGHMVSCSQEIAGIGGDAKFGKVDLQVQLNKRLTESGASVQLAGGVGVVRSLGKSHCLNIADRFLLGGPLTLRGFQINGCGPHEEGLALGSDTYWLGAAHLYLPLPFRFGRSEFGQLFRLHGFVNAGNLTCIDLKQPIKCNLESLKNSLRASCGAGIAFRLGEIARLELNYCYPLRSCQEDRLVNGLQFGIGLKFL